MKKLYEKGEAIRKDQPDLTPEQAFARAVRENPDLYTAYRKERLES